jgi:dihydroneopterin aldolase
MTDHLDRLSLLGMRFEGRHGVLPEEKLNPQRFEIDVVLDADLDPAARSDDLTRTVDYAEVFALVEGIATGPSFDLIEALAGAIADAVLAATDEGIVSGIEVRVRKPNAPIDGAFDTVEAALVRRRPHTVED